jgi:hypothetical protein
MEIQNLQAEDIIVQRDGTTILILEVKNNQNTGGGYVVQGLWSHDGPGAGPRESWGLWTDSILRHFRAERVIRDGEVLVILDESGNDITGWRLDLEMITRKLRNKLVHGS